jgi:polyisoprenoid-binding protein YceI
MKHTLILAFFLAASALAHAQLSNGSHTLSVNESLITWNVNYSIGKKGHEGTLNLTSGTILVKDGIIQGGNFTINMNSVRATDMTGEGAKDLEDHLKGDDFLSTKNHPKGYFTVLNSASNPTGKITVSGYLILKGISNTISFPISVLEKPASITIKSTLVVNRTLWGINYQSGSIFGTLKDEAISDDMNITLNFTFKKAQ